MNPILPLNFFVPDVEAHQFADGRIYLYGSLDISGDGFYCSDSYRVFSSDNLVQWKDHGTCFDLGNCHSSTANRLFAPDCIDFKGKYYLYYCGDDRCEGLAVSDSPAGPFCEAKPVTGADGDAIDPAIFVDDDGSFYYLWGQFDLRGAKLNSDLASIDESTLNTQIINEKQHGFHEGASLRKRGDTYYLIYTDISRGRASCLAYATSKSPLGPYEKGGIIIDNTGCDPQTWNNHGSIVEFNGQWYVFYHRSSQNSVNNRRVCVEPIHFNDDGSIDEVEMTTQGILPALDPTQPMLACRACKLSGEVFISPIQRFTKDDEFREVLGFAHNGNWACYKYFDFDRSDQLRGFEITLGSSIGGGCVEVRADSPQGDILALCKIPNTDGWKIFEKITAELVSKPGGIHAIYLVFTGGKGRLADVFDFRFV